MMKKADYVLKLSISRSKNRPFQNEVRGGLRTIFVKLFYSRISHQMVLVILFYSFVSEIVLMIRIDVMEAGGSPRAASPALL